MVSPSNNKSPTPHSPTPRIAEGVEYIQMLLKSGNIFIDEKERRNILKSDGYSDREIDEILKLTQAYKGPTTTKTENQASKISSPTTTTPSSSTSSSSSTTFSRLTGGFWNKSPSNQITETTENVVKDTFHKDKKNLVSNIPSTPSKNPSTPTTKLNEIKKFIEDSRYRRWDEALIRSLLEDSYNSQEINEAFALLDKPPHRTASSPSSTKISSSSTVSTPTTSTSSTRSTSSATTEMQPERYTGLPGTWYLMETAQSKEDASNACTTIATYTASRILQNPSKEMNAKEFNDCIRTGSKDHLTKFGKSPDNRMLDEVSKDFDWAKNLKVKEESLWIQPQYSVKEAKTAREEFVKTVIKTKPCVALISDGLETIVVHCTGKEFLVYDSHIKRFSSRDQDIDLKNAYAVKLSNEEELITFLTRYRYPFVEESHQDYHDGNFQGYNPPNMITAGIITK